ncbi:MAG: hypothetical protein M3011_02060 [Actinomycetota bacterium]|nr:hypothetical protein [Actinomycetota bacterium]
MFDDQVPVSRLVLRSARTGVVVLVLVAVATAYASRRIATAEAVDNANRVATLVAGAAIEPLLDDGVLTADPATTGALDRAVRGQLLRGSLVRVKIWRTDGTIVYSDESRLVGQKFGLGQGELATLRTGRSEAGLSDLSEPENRYEGQATKLLEVYVPVHTRGGTPLLFETYFRYEGVAESGRRLWLRFAPLILGALVLLALLQVPQALSLGRRLRRTQQQREDLLSDDLANRHRRDCRHRRRRDAVFGCSHGHGAVPSVPGSRSVAPSRGRVNLSFVVRPSSSGIGATVLFGVGRPCARRCRWPDADPWGQASEGWLRCPMVRGVLQVHRLSSHRC